MVEDASSKVRSSQLESLIKPVEHHQENQETRKDEENSLVLLTKSQLPIQRPIPLYPIPLHIREKLRATASNMEPEHHCVVENSQASMMLASSQPHLRTANKMDHHHPQSLLPYHHPALAPLGLHHPDLSSR